MNTTRDWKGILAHVARLNGFEVESDAFFDHYCYIFKQGHERFRVPVADPALVGPDLTGAGLDLWASVTVMKAVRQLSWFTFTPDPVSEDWDNRRWIDRMI